MSTATMRPTAAQGVSCSYYRVCCRSHHSRPKSECPNGLHCTSKQKRQGRRSKHSILRSNLEVLPLIGAHPKNNVDGSRFFSSGQTDIAPVRQRPENSQTRNMKDCNKTSVSKIVNAKSIGTLRAIYKPTKRHKDADDVREGNGRYPCKASRVRFDRLIQVWRKPEQVWIIILLNCIRTQADVRWKPIQN